MHFAIHDSLNFILESWISKTQKTKNAWKRKKTHPFLLRLFVQRLLKFCFKGRQKIHPYFARVIIHRKFAKVCQIDSLKIDQNVTKVFVSLIISCWPRWVRVIQRICFLPNVFIFPLPARLQWVEPAGGGAAESRNPLTLNGKCICWFTLTRPRFYTRNLQFLIRLFLFIIEQPKEPRKL